jgi:hypothetical protein
MAHTLADLRVVELATTDAGAFCGLQMVGLGADVVKVEVLPNGDPTRQSGLIPTPGGTTVSPRFVYLNGGKRGLAMDRGETARLERLLGGADVVIDDGLADELGVEPLLREARVAVRIRPFGGAFAIGSSLTTAAHGGWLATCGDPGSRAAPHAWAPSGARRRSHGLHWGVGRFTSASPGDGSSSRCGGGGCRCRELGIE